MAFSRKEADKLLADTGRRCCICGSLHNVSLHHIVPLEEGGTDDIDNAIPLCPSCHDEVHGRLGYAAGRTTRTYTADELRLHRQRTIEQVQREIAWSPGNSVWEEDKNLILFYAQCLDRPAFHTGFHQEISFSAFDKAMEDTLVALNTGYWKTRDGTLIKRAKGKVNVIHQPWREKLERIVEIIEDVRSRFHAAFGLDRMLYNNRWFHNMLMEDSFRHDRALGDWMDDKRQEAIEIMNSMLQDIGHQPLRGIGQH